MRLSLSPFPSISTITHVEGRRTAHKSYAQIQKIAKTSRIECSERECTITWEPQGAAQFPAEAQRRAADHARMKALAAKWRDGALNAAEKDELLRLFVVAELASD